ncbi:MAG: hypothetical protein HKN20_04345, partial [Gemmatimonadetes bacterium]|nr:hypothetical protein [Gemmatimonadota bacterium]
HQYMNAFKEFLAGDISGLVNDPLAWSPGEVGWYDMPWTAQGSALPSGGVDPNSGREALIGSYTGQILQPNTFQTPSPAVPFQNHAVIYYNDVAGAFLGRIWKDVFGPDLTDTQFPEGSICVKVEAATLTPKEWPPLEGASKYYVYRPTVGAIDSLPPDQLQPEVVPVWFSQMAVAVKDFTASPQTGWVYMAFAYDKDAKGKSVWEKAVPVGAMWGNDPEFARLPAGKKKGVPLKETWVNPKAPQYTLETLGWGGRLAGPMDVATRHNVVTVSGKRYQGDDDLDASSCLSCHSAAQYPFFENLYASPNVKFPEDGDQFLFYDPGSEEWARWFQNRPGTVPLSADLTEGVVSLDYDMLLTFALMTYNVAAGNPLATPPRIHVH